MAKLLAALSVALALVLGLVLALRGAHEPARDTGAPELAPGGTQPPGDDWRAALEAERRRVDALERELATLRLELDRGAERIERRVEQPIDEARTAAEGGEERDARWYLDQYVRSFGGGGTGSEYFRLAVQAYAPELVEPIADLVRSRSSRAPLRAGLAGILGDARLAGNDRAISALLGTVVEDEPQQLVAHSIASLRVIADAARLGDLVARVWRVAHVRGELLRLVLDLSGDTPNATLAMLFRTAPDEQAELELIALLRPFDLDGAIELFSLASFRERDTRLAAAHRTREFRDPRTLTLVDEWAAREPDEEVRRVLVGARDELTSVPRWGAERATGAPDAQDPKQDSIEAWAPSSSDARMEWIELGYAPASHANEIRVHEVCTAGGVARAILIDESGARHTVWEGVDPTASPGVFSIRFDTTSYRVRAVRLEIDTRRRQGWEEIDAVELRGPDGSQWASMAHASSVYGVGKNDSIRTLELLRTQGYVGER